MLSGCSIGVSGIACADDDARAKTKATLIILIIIYDDPPQEFLVAAETNSLAIGLRGNNVRFGSFAAELFGLRAALCPLLVR